MVNQYCAHSFTRNWQLAFLNQRKGEDDRIKYFLIKSPQKNVADPAGVIMDTILMEMSKMWKVTDGYTNKGRTMVNRPRLKLTWRKALGKLTIEYLQDGCCDGHRGYHNKMVSAILNLHVAPMSPTKVWLNLNYHKGADEVWKFSRLPP